MTVEDELKQIPYGEANFNDFKVKNLYYVDKTRFIRDIEKKGSYLFLIRPRRFGKSLFLGIMPKREVGHADSRCIHGIDNIREGAVATGGDEHVTPPG